MPWRAQVRDLAEVLEEQEELRARHPSGVPRAPRGAAARKKSVDVAASMMEVRREGSGQDGCSCAAWLGGHPSGDVHGMGGTGNGSEAHHQ